MKKNKTDKINAKERLSAKLTKRESEIIIGSAKDLKIFVKSVINSEEEDFTIGELMIIARRTRPTILKRLHPSLSPNGDGTIPKNVCGRRKKGVTVKKSWVYARIQRYNKGLLKGDFL